MSPIIVPGSGDPVLLKLGGLDLTAYARLYGDAGFDTADSTGFLEPQFNTSPLGSGQPLVSVTETNREMAIPLYLNDASKDNLHALVREINLEIRNTTPLRIEWQDHDASVSTFYDVAYARFDPSYDFPKARAGWLAGVLRVWCAPPYGHTATERVVGTAVATHQAFSTVPLGSLPVGDAPALIDLGLGVRQGYCPSNAAVVGLSVLPDGYLAEWRTPSLIATSGASIIACQEGVASQARRSFLNSTQMALPDLVLPTATPYVGRNRVIGIMRTSATAGLNVWAANQQGAALGPTQTFVPIDPSTEFFPVDLGTLSVDEHFQPTQIVSIQVGQAGAFASHTVDLTDVLLLPEESTTLLADPGTGSQLASYTIKGTVELAMRDSLTKVSGRAPFVPAYQTSEFLNDRRRGAQPHLTPGVTQQVAVFNLLNPGNYCSIGVSKPVSFTAEIKIREQFSYAR